MNNNDMFVCFTLILFLVTTSCKTAKINTPRVLLPWFDKLVVNFTFEISEGGCYSWTLSRNDIIELEPLYEDSWGRCSRAARVSVSKSCEPPGSVIILAEEINSGEILRGDVDINKITSFKVMSTTWKLYLEEAPEAFEVVAYDSDGNKFSTLEGVKFIWTIRNVDQSDDALVKLVRWSDTDYEAPPSVAVLEEQGFKSYMVLLYGQAMGDAQVTVCLNSICTDFTLNVVASVVLTPATAIIAPGDTLRYKVVRARAGRLTVQDVKDTLYYLKLSNDKVGLIEDGISLVRGTTVGSTPVILMSGVTEVATSILNVAEPHSIRVSLRPPNLLVRGQDFIVHCIVLDAQGHVLMAGDEMIIRLSVEGDAKVDLLRSNNNGTITDAVTRAVGEFVVTAQLYSIGGRAITHNVEGKVTGIVVDPLEVIPPELFISSTDSLQEFQLTHSGGGDEDVIWSPLDNDRTQKSLSVNAVGVISVRGIGEMNVKVQMKKYSHIWAAGRVVSALPEYLQVLSSGQARVNKPHHLHVTLAATHPATGEFYNFHKCNCGMFILSVLEGPEPHNVTAATWIKPVEGACCVLEVVWPVRGISMVRVSGGRAGDSCRVTIRAAPQLVWPPHAAALLSATQPVLALGEALVPDSKDSRIADLIVRDGPPPHNYPDLQLFTLQCHKKGDTKLKLSSQTVEEEENVEFEVACATHVSKINLDPPESPNNCSLGPKLWLKPRQEVKLQVTLLDAIGRELLDERGPKVKWTISPGNKGIEYRAVDRLFIETHPDFVPVSVPYKYYQVVIADEKAIGWSGQITANIPDATATIQARVVATLTCDSKKVHLSWEGESLVNVVEVSGGSGRYAVEAPKGVTTAIDEGQLSAAFPGAGTYDLVILDMCIPNEKQYIEVHLEEAMSVEVSTSRAVCVGACVPIAAFVKGHSNEYLRSSRTPEWRTSGPLEVKGDQLCGVKEGVGRVRASSSGVWSNELEVLVFPSMSIIPSRIRLPVGGRLQLRHAGGPPSHLATLTYEAVDGMHNIEVSSTGQLIGVSLGGGRVKLFARDIYNVELAVADAEIEVVPISGLKVRSATQNLLVGAPCPLWLEAEGLGPTVLSGLQPMPRVTWSLRDSNTARLITTHADDLLERPVAEGLSVRLIPLKPGLITVDVTVRNMGKIVESRSWDNVIEILAISDIHTSIEGSPKELSISNRIALAVGSVVHLRSLPRGNWHSYSEDGTFELTSRGELKAIKPGYGAVVTRHNDERNQIYRETIMHIEVAIPHYCTVEPSGDDDEAAVRLVMRNSIGRELIAPDTTVSAYPPLAMHVRKNIHSALGNELVLTGLDLVGAFMAIQGTVSGVTLKDEIWVTGSDSQSDRSIACGGWAVCLDGLGWRAPSTVALHEGAGVTLAVLNKDTAGKHTLKADRPHRSHTVHQLLVAKIEFQPGDWPYSLVPLNIEGNGLTTGPLLCTEEQLSALDGLEVQLPFTCKTPGPHSAQAILDFNKGQMGCSIIPANEITEASEVEICAEWGTSKTCTRTLLLPPVTVSSNKISLGTPPTMLTIYGHPQALKFIKLTTSPGLKIETNSKTEGKHIVSLGSDVAFCGYGWVTVKSRLTSQRLRIEVQRECDQGCSSILGAIFSLIRPYLVSLATIAAVSLASVYVYGKIYQKSVIRPPMQPFQTVLPPMEMTPPLNRTNTWSRSPYASNGPATPIYGDASTLPDQSFSPNSTRNHSRFL